MPANPAGLPLTTVADGVRVALRVTPRAGRNAITGLALTADGGVVLKVAVTAAPEGGRANDAVIKLLAKAWSLPKSALSIIVGTADRNKLLHIAGAPDELTRRLTDRLRSERQDQRTGP
ncbi:MAG: DUF167 domain-containing protein [Azospirillum sp.]|nr:DUF167 domain-containing protein [Azospirillum sp.]